MTINEISVNALAKMCGQSRDTIIRWIDGRKEVPLRFAIYLNEISLGQITFRDLYRPYALRYGKPIINAAKNYL